MGELDFYNKEVLEEIERVKEVYGPKPQCYFLCLHLQSIFTGGKIWYDMNHCLFWYRGGLYDHTGEVVLGYEELNRYLPLEEYGFTQIEALQKAMFETNGRLEV